MCGSPAPADYRTAGERRRSSFLGRFLDRSCSRASSCRGTGSRRSCGRGGACRSRFADDARFAYTLRGSRLRWPRRPVAAGCRQTPRRTLELTLQRTDQATKGLGGSEQQRLALPGPLTALPRRKYFALPGHPKLLLVSRCPHVEWKEQGVGQRMNCVLFLRVDRVEAAHPVMPEPAQLSAWNFPFTGGAAVKHNRLARQVHGGSGTGCPEYANC